MATSLGPPVRSATVLDSSAEQLAAHLPDLVITRSFDAPIPQTIHTYGVIVFADISGYTALCEKYCRDADKKTTGTDQLSSTLNSYMSQIVQCILQAEGDVLKFAGDALLAFWSCSQFTVQEVLYKILGESLKMQNNFDNFQTSDGVTLRMKVGLSIGKVDVHFIGNEKRRTFDVTGEAIDDANVAQNHTKSGSVVISKLAWNMLTTKDRCVATIVGPGCAQVSSICQITAEGSQQNLVKATNLRKNRSFVNLLHSAPRSKSVDVVNPWEEGEQSFSLDTNRKDANAHSKELNFNYRPKLEAAHMYLSSEAQQALRAYIIPSVVHRIDHGLKTRWLSEMREVSVLFINLNPKMVLSSLQTRDFLQNSFEIIQAALGHRHGTMNKVFMFDKGCTFLCIFGLPHKRHEHNVWNALSAAREIYKNLGTLDIIAYQSIGVTTGVAFCGVVGHPQRHEFTVISPKVNMAARLMMSFRGQIMCDRTTKIKSMFSDKQFIRAPPVPLKGISKPEPIYKFSIEQVDSSEERSWDAQHPHDDENMIGRDKEMQIFTDELHAILSHSARSCRVVFILGSGGMGKTKLLRAMKSRATKLGFRVLSSHGGLVEQNTSFHTVRTLLSRLLDLDIWRSVHDKEEALLKRVSNKELMVKLPLLNNLLNLNLPHTPFTSAITSETDREEQCQLLLHEIVHEETNRSPCMFGLDNVQLLDDESWEFLLNVSVEPNLVIVLTSSLMITMESIPPPMQDILGHEETIILHLDGLSPPEMVQLASQKLGVSTIPEEIETLIQNRSLGNPLWGLELVDVMLDLKYLEVKGMKAEINPGKRTKLILDRQNSTAMLEVCPSKRRKLSPASSSSVVTHPKLNIPIPDSVAGMVLTRINNLPAMDQMILKCASVAGFIFKKELLQSIIPNCPPENFNLSLNNLAKCGLLECATAAQVQRGSVDEALGEAISSMLDTRCACLSQGAPVIKAVESSRSTRLLKCLSSSSDLNLLSEHATSTPTRIDQCTMIQFVHSYTQETVYSLWTEKQRRKLHQAAAEYFEMRAHRCINCGGGPFISGNIDDKDEAASGMPLNDPEDGPVSEEILAERSSTSSLIYVDSGNEEEDSEEKEGRYRKFVATSKEKVGHNLDRIFATNAERLGLHCSCNKVVNYVYPQLVEHWRSSGNVINTTESLIEGGAAAVAMNQNARALSLLREAAAIISDGLVRVSKMKEGRLYSLMGQTFYQMQLYHEAIHWFHMALDRMAYKVSGRIKAGMVLIKHYVLSKFPGSFSGRPQSCRIPTPGFYNKARCLVYLVHSYHKQNKRFISLVPAKKLLNLADRAMCRNSHELIEAYGGLVECCQLLGYPRLADHYFKTAVTYCGTVEFTILDTKAYAQLLHLGVVLKLYLGSYDEAKYIGEAALTLSTAMKDSQLKFAVLPFIFFTSMAKMDKEKSMEYLQLICNAASEVDDLQGTAIYDCCHFDGLLELGIDWPNEVSIVAKAEENLRSDMYHCSDVERFFLRSCLALWNARQNKTTQAHSYLDQASRDLENISVDKYFSIRALSRYTECMVLLSMHHIPTYQVNRAKKALQKFDEASNRYRVFKSRFFLYTAIYKRIVRKIQDSDHYITSTISEASQRGSDYDMQWAQKHRAFWREPHGSMPSSVNNNGSNEFFIFLFKLD